MVGYKVLVGTCFALLGLALRPPKTIANFECESPLSSKPKPWCLLSEEDIGMSRHVFQETAMGK